MLLHTSEESAHGFRAKISDFGMARNIGTVTKLETSTYGTITHMAPEVLAHDYISKVRGNLRVNLVILIKGRRFMPDALHLSGPAVLNEVFQNSTDSTTSAEGPLTFDVESENACFLAGCRCVLLWSTVLGDAGRAAGLVRHEHRPDHPCCSHPEQATATA